MHRVRWGSSFRQLACARACGQRVVKDARLRRLHGPGRAWAAIIMACPSRQATTRVPSASASDANLTPAWPRQSWPSHVCLGRYHDVRLFTVGQGACREPFNATPVGAKSI